MPRIQRGNKKSEKVSITDLKSNSYKYPFNMSSLKIITILVAFLIITSLERVSGQVGHFSQPVDPVLVNVKENLKRLIEDEDTDGDKKITIEDISVKDNGRGDKRFWLVATNGKRYEVVGTYYLSNLLEELILAQEVGIITAGIDLTKVFENPVERISRSIREIYWNDLTRRIDEHHIDQILLDEKITAGGFRYLHVPQTDTRAYEYFLRVSEHHPDLKLHVERLPDEITPEYVRSLDSKHGILSLALEQTSEEEYSGVPFVVPGGRFNEMYGWDSYFIALGLLEDGRIDLAKAIVDNSVYQIMHYGKILNANRTYYLTRSQPPFLTSMALAVYEHLPGNVETKTWLKSVFLAAIKEYHEVWMNEDRLTETGLSRYYGSGIGPPPEVETGHFDAIYRPYAVKHSMDTRQFEELYKAGKIMEPELDKFFVHDRAVRESGHDTSYRWDLEGNRCADFVTVDLNSLLYKIELDIARNIDAVFGGSLTRKDGVEEKSSTWHARARKRKKLVNRYLWDDQSGMFFDYDLVRKERYVYESATTFYPLWACHKEDPETWLITVQQAKRLVENALPLLETNGGVVVSTKESRGPISELRPARQWDYPNGWAPHQMLIWRGLINYGFDETAYRLAYRWLYTITRNAVDYNGTVTEKLDVVKRSHEVFAEYGNVGTKFAYITKEGFGWTNASYQVGLKILPPELYNCLERLIPPEWLFER